MINFLMGKLKCNLKNSEYMHVHLYLRHNFARLKTYTKTCKYGKKKFNSDAPSRASMLTRAVSSFLDKQIM